VIRVVLDANVYISALVFGGAPQDVIDLIQMRRLHLYTSRSIMDEVAGVLARKFDWTAREIEFALPPLWGRCIVVKPSIRLRVSPDPDDNHVLECAEVAQADFLITGNTKHFPTRYRSTKVVTVRQFLQHLEALPKD
jgi:putative PIN family toxin of toxin-antitoxin system